MNTMNIELIRGDITAVETDAIVNAANKSLLGGGGVDGAIHRAAGPELLEECRTLNGCEVGQAKITGGYKLKARFVIHTVGPVWRGGANSEAALLARCYRSALLLCREYHISSIAFPSISTGVYGYPIQQAAVIAIREIKDFLVKNNFPSKVIIVTFSPYDYEIYRKLIENE